jgi:hypothetical protein
MDGREQETPGPTHIESLRSTSNIPTLRDIVETRKAPLVQNGIEEPQGGQPNAQPIVVQQGNQSGHNGRRRRSSASPGDVPRPEEPVSERESGDIGEPLQRRSQKNYVRLRNFKARSAYATVPANAETTCQSGAKRCSIGGGLRTGCRVHRRVHWEAS